MWTEEWRIIWMKIIAVVYATYAVAKRKPKKIFRLLRDSNPWPLRAAPVSQRSRVRILHKPEFFSQLHKLRIQLRWSSLIILITLCFSCFLERVQVPVDENFLDVFVCNIHSTDNICVNLSGEEYSVSILLLITLLLARVPKIKMHEKKLIFFS